ncbi:ABC transporter substrate-binding protein [Streptacidiphilus sp. P02-A3a]|uniref:ABC transporter substrate-binding protein n=1 Tax=Streptacidiphilus sp. P02-A3a TaxID=2704468 RepID=UPI0015F907DB|nr:ABC transporter substrate-binding protein [Streptacidiphilus sp. P02-A3a]QMU71452.1 substrate-binding domain-containing protein [Streptacidiphilus sp. P02-A3a]
MRSRTTRLLAATGTVIALTAAAGCGSSGGSSSGSHAGSSGSASSGALRGKTIDMITGVKSDPFYISMTCGAQQEAARLGVTLKADGSAQWDVSVQRPIIDADAATRPDGLMISPVDTAALTPALQQVQQSGTKIALVDTSVTDPSIGVTRISSDNEAGGRTAADALGALMGGHGTAIVVSVTPGVSTTDARTKGFTEEMAAKFPGVTLLSTLYDNDLPATAASEISATLAAHPGLTGVFAANTNTAQGIATGLQAAGKQGKVKVAAFDAEPAEVQALQSGTLQILIAQDPAAIGRDGVDQLVAAFEGKPVTPQIGTTMVAITQKDFASMSQYVYQQSC